MDTLDRSATCAGDIAVELQGVNKIFYQRQRSAHVRDVFKNLFRPRVREIRALQDVDLVVRRGEIVAYAGPNGAGKSTTVKLLSSVLAPTAGSVRALGNGPDAGPGGLCQSHWRGLWPAHRTVVGPARVGEF